MSCNFNKEHFTLVQSGNSSLNEWRKENPGARLKLNGSQFNGLATGSLDLSNADLEGATFTSCKISNSVFKNSNLEAALFFDCDLQKTIFIDANLKRTSFISVNLSAAEFGDNATISRIEQYILNSDVQDPPKYSTSKIPVWDRFMTWEKLRFMRSINIFVPSYAALVLSVLYLNGFSAFNYAIQITNDVIARSPELLGIEPIEFLEPGVRHFWVLTAFFCLAVAATLFLACPSRITDYSREQWESEVRKSSLAYEHACWSRRWARIPCTVLLVAGGLIAAILLLVFVCSQAVFILNYPAQNGA